MAQSIEHFIKIPILNDADVNKVPANFNLIEDIFSDMNFFL